MNKHRFVNKNFTVFQYSMVELVLSLVVVISAIIVVMGLFPVGVASNKRVMGVGFATDAGEQFLRFNVSRIKRDWKWINVFADRKPGSEEPKVDEWSDNPIFSIGNVRVTPARGLNPSLEANTGFFLLEKFTGDRVDFSGILRVWKDLSVNEGSSQNALLQLEVSWPMSAPYDSPGRQRNFFSIEVVKTPEISLAAASYNDCTVTRFHGGGFSTTLSRVAKGTNGAFNIELKVDYDGCSDMECLELQKYVVESNASLGNVSVNGDGATGVILESPQAGYDPFDGFKIVFDNGIGGNSETGSFVVTYTLDSLQDQDILVINERTQYKVNFSIAEFEYVYSCVQ